ncbi:MAG: hypothetical protein H6739_23225 [Alphaproteobacteria bacterium]|nr:hypothetical protein [Alphaproteobacteria bacterium]
MRAMTIPCVLVFTLFGCSGGDGPEIEGDDGGECSDGADNDQDGYFDCDDQGCWGSPDCDQVNPGDDTGVDGDDTGSGGDDTGSGGDDTGSGGDDTGNGGNGAGVVTSADVTLHVTFDVINGTLGISDCETSYAGSGTQLRATDTRVEMQGSWRITETTCTEGNAVFNDIVWVSGTEEAYHTFTFDAGLTYMSMWTVHRDEGDYQPDSTRNKWPMFDLRATIDWGDGTAQHSEDFTDSDGTRVIFDLEVTFERAD